MIAVADEPVLQLDLALNLVRDMLARKSTLQQSVTTLPHPDPSSATVSMFRRSCPSYPTNALMSEG